MKAGVMDSERKPKKASFTPVLDAILHGGSGVALNMIEIARHFDRDKCLFKSRVLNDAVIFKFPNFQEEISETTKKAFGGPGAAMDSNPVETGIYLPYSTENPDDGGCAVYMRQKNYQRLLLDMIGATPVYAPGEEPPPGTEPELPPAVVYDLKLLSLLDSIPTLDPFLLKECLTASGIEFDSSVLRLDPAEETEIRRLISEKISPIIQKAFEAGNKVLSNRERLLEALWDPTMPEARAFVTAFGIKESEAGPVFTAWKGVTFYQLQVRATLPKLKEMLAWLKSKDSIPVDAPANKAFMPQLQMFNVKIHTLINQTVAEMRGILKKYEASFETFIGGNPSELTAFLRSARRIYYVLGYCISSLNSAVAIYYNAVKPPNHVRLSFDDTNKLYARLDTTLSRRREVPANF